MKNLIDKLVIGAAIGLSACFLSLTSMLTREYAEFNRKIGEATYKADNYFLGKIIKELQERSKKHIKTYGCEIV